MQFFVIFQSQNTFVAIVDLPEGEHQYKFYVDGQWTHDPAEVSDYRPIVHVLQGPSSKPGYNLPGPFLFNLWLW